MSPWREVEFEKSLFPTAADDSGRPESLSERQLNEVSHAVEIFGMDVVRNSVHDQELKLCK